jgi:hypothetical protein
MGNKINMGKGFSVRRGVYPHYEVQNLWLKIKRRVIVANGTP